MLRGYHRLERGEVDPACAWRAVVFPGELHVMDVKTRQPAAQRLQMHRVMNEPEVFLDLRVAGVVPVNQIRARDLAEQELVIAVDGQFLERLPILDASRMPRDSASGRIFFKASIVRSMNFSFFASRFSSSSAQSFRYLSVSFSPRAVISRSFSV